MADKNEVQKTVTGKIVQNGVSRPGAGTATGAVWDIADELSAVAGEPAKRGDVMQAAEEKGLNKATTATQYGRWRKFHGLGRYTEEQSTEESAE